jgi:UDP-N-acetylmuramate--alanine ligase
MGEARYTVMEADEFDRSFHRLNPAMAIITSLDADHLDVYGDHATMLIAYNEFCSKIKRGGILFVNSKILNELDVPEGVKCFTYGLDPLADFQSFNINHEKDFYNFNLKTPSAIIENLNLGLPGIINIENFTAAIAMALLCGVTENEIRKAVELFQGVRRRFDVRINRPGIAYVDDYAHHPEEIKVFINAVKEYFRGRKVTGIFQPHLYTRTRDHANGFATSLDELDEVIILPIYPARENPIEGVTSALILDKMKIANKRLSKMEDLLGELESGKLDVLVTIGAGDIDTIVSKIESRLNKDMER